MLSFKWIPLLNAVFLVNEKWFQWNYLFLNFFFSDELRIKKIICLKKLASLKVLLKEKGGTSFLLACS